MQVPNSRNSYTELLESATSRLEVAVPATPILVTNAQRVVAPLKELEHAADQRGIITHGI